MGCVQLNLWLSASPYSELMQKTMDGFTELAKNAYDKELVERIILDADSNPSPHLQYLACKDVESWAAGKKNMDDFEFFNMIKGINNL